MIEQWTTVLDVTEQLIIAMQSDDWITVEKKLSDRQFLLEQIKLSSSSLIDGEIAKKILAADRRLVDIFEEKYQSVISNLSEIKNIKKINNIYNQNT